MEIWQIELIKIGGTAIVAFVGGGLGSYWLYLRKRKIENTPDKEGKTPHLLELTNPMLLSVKMFLANVIHIINRKYEEGHVCANFAQEVYDAATEKGIRCGYVVISFENSNVGHAIVSFQTDYGLKFFEPQNGNEEEVIVGLCYSTQLEGIPKCNIVTKIEITWNDGTTTIID